MNRYTIDVCWNGMWSSDYSILLFTVSNWIEKKGGGEEKKDDTNKCRTKQNVKAAKVVSQKDLW